MTRVTVYVHVDCGGMVEFRERVVIAKPDDATWPVDVICRVPWCTRCKTVVDSDSVNRTTM